MKEVRLDEAAFEGVVSCEQGIDWIKPWRLPYTELGLFPPTDGIVSRAEMAAGCRLHFSTDSTTVEVSFVAAGEERLFDLTIGDALVASQVAKTGVGSVTFADLPKGSKTVEIWLPQSHAVSLKAVFIEDWATFSVQRDDRKRWITYGSSISHCGATHSPARTWPATAARLRGLRLTCLGYGGQCHIDSMVARMIRDLPADFISLKLGINVYGASSLNVRSFKPAIIGMVKIIREKHPCIPIALISPIFSPCRETEKNAVGFTLQEMRVQVEDAVKRLQDSGDENVHYFSGLELLGKKLAPDCLPDDLHPNGDGYEIMGKNFAEKVYDVIFRA